MCGCSSSPLAAGPSVDKVNLSIAASATNSSVVFNTINGEVSVPLSDFLVKIDYNGVLGNDTFLSDTKLALEQLKTLFLNKSNEGFNENIKKMPSVFIDALLTATVTPSIYINSSSQNYPLYFKLPAREISVTFLYLADSEIVFVGNERGIRSQSKTFLSFVCAGILITPLFFGAFTTEVKSNVLPSVERVTPNPLAPAAPSSNLNTSSENVTNVARSKNQWSCYCCGCCDDDCGGPIII